MRLAILLVAVAACVGERADETAPRSGERIKLVKYEYDGGSLEREREFFYDMALGTLCYEETWSDGARYCTPDAAEAVYANDHCTKPVGVVRATTVPQFFATHYVLHDTPLISALYEVGQPTTPPSVIWRETDLGCVGPFEVDPANLFFYDVGELVDVKEARIRHSLPEGTKRLVDLFATSDDGMRLAVDNYDQQLDFPCRIDGDANTSSATCKPAITDGFVTVFADADCSTPVIPVDTPAPPTIARREDPRTGCTTYFRITNELAPPSLYRIAGGSCVPDMVSSAPHYYDAARLELASVERRRVGTGRVQAIEVGDLAISDNLMFDSLLDTDCERVLLPSGELRCLPASSATIQTLFADEACLRPVDVALVPTRACDVPERYVRDDDVHAIGDVYPSPLYEITTGDRCGEFPVPTGFVAHSIGPALPEATFPIANMSFEP